MTHTLHSGFGLQPELLHKEIFDRGWPCFSSVLIICSYYLILGHSTEMSLPVFFSLRSYVNVVNCTYTSAFFILIVISKHFSHSSENVHSVRLQYFSFFSDHVSEKNDMIVLNLLYWSFVTSDCNIQASSCIICFCYLFVYFVVRVVVFVRFIDVL